MPFSLSGLRFGAASDLGELEFWYVELGISRFGCCKVSRFEDSLFVRPLLVLIAEVF